MGSNVQSIKQPINKENHSSAYPSCVLTCGNKLEFCYATFPGSKRTEPE